LQPTKRKKIFLSREKSKIFEVFFKSLQVAVVIEPVEMHSLKHLQGLGMNIQEKYIGVTNWGR
jgi:hypothetical protein